jgi:kynureninase
VVLDAHTSCVMVSSVLFETAEIVPNLSVVAETCRRHGASLLVDAYHHLNVVPFDVESMGLHDAFITGGGYKYCQLGEGNAFLRVPPGTRMRPVLTGWFAAFETLEDTRAGRVGYGDGAAAFAGATYDPTSHYRAAAVLAFHQERGLTADHLRQISRRHVTLLRSQFDALDVPRALAHVVPMAEDRRGGFLAVRTPEARHLLRLLRERGVHADARGETLRLGPAPYLRDDQLRDAIRALDEALRELSAGAEHGS